MTSGLVVRNIAPGSHALPLKTSPSTTVVQNDFFNVTILKLPSIKCPIDALAAPSYNPVRGGSPCRIDQTIRGLALEINTIHRPGTGNAAAAGISVHQFCEHPNDSCSHQRYSATRWGRPSWPLKPMGEPIPRPNGCLLTTKGTWVSNRRIRGPSLDVTGDAKFNGPLNVQGALTVDCSRGNRWRFTRDGQADRGKPCGRWSWIEQRHTSRRLHNQRQTGGGCRLTLQSDRLKMVIRAHNVGIGTPNPGRGSGCRRRCEVQRSINCPGDLQQVALRKSAEIYA